MNTKYKAPAYDEQKYRQGIDTSFYEKAKQSYMADANASRERQLADAQRQQQANVRQAYINRLQNERRLNDNLAMQGIRGGTTETANLRLANQYGAERAAANTDYTNTVNSVNQTIDQNIADYRRDMDSKAEEYLQNIAQARWQADREDTNNEIARQTEYWSNYYMNLYSGMKKKEARAKLKEFQKQLKETNNPMKKIRLEQAISALGARIGVIRNK